MTLLTFLVETFVRHAALIVVVMALTAALFGGRLAPLQPWMRAALYATAGAIAGLAAYAASERAGFVVSLVLLAGMLLLAFALSLPAVLVRTRLARKATP